MLAIARTLYRNEPGQEIQNQDLVDYLHACTRIDKWFLHRMRAIIDMYRRLELHREDTVGGEKWSHFNHFRDARKSGLKPVPRFRFARFWDSGFRLLFWAQKHRFSLRLTGHAQPYFIPLNQFLHYFRFLILISVIKTDYDKNYNFVFFQQIIASKNFNFNKWNQNSKLSDSHFSQMIILPYTFFAIYGFIKVFDPKNYP